jgi:hypothetical protein
MVFFDQSMRASKSLAAAGNRRSGTNSSLEIAPKPHCIEGMRVTHLSLVRCVGALIVWLIGNSSSSLFGQDARGSETILLGVGIGHVILGQTQGDVHATLGSPKLSGGGISGRIWEIWRSGVAFDRKRQNGLEELEVYFARDRSNPQAGSIVRQIRVTSPFFKTASGISIRSRYAEIINAFPNLHRDEVLTDSLNDGRSEKEFEILVDMTRGIGFEFRSGAAADPNADGYCAAIHVFRPGTEPRVMDAFDRESQVPSR